MGDYHVVFGAAGSLGSAIVRKLAADGKRVRAVVRNPDKARKLFPSGAEISVGDATGSDSVRAKCRDASVVYHCVNVPYPQWPEIMPGVTRNILVAAKGAEAKLVFPGNVYGYGPFKQIPAKEDHPRAATGKKGRLRNQMEEQLLQAHQKGEVKLVIPRFPDYYGPNVTNKLYGAPFVAALKGGKALWLGNLDVPHDLVFIDDAALACILLAETENAYGQVWHVPGTGQLTGRQFLEMVFQAVGSKPKIRVMVPTTIKLVGLFIPIVRELNELLYLYLKPNPLDGSKFSRTFPSFEYTPHLEAIRVTLKWFRQYGQN